MRYKLVVAFVAGLTTMAHAQYQSLTIRQIQEVPLDSLLLLDSTRCARGSQASPYYHDTVFVTGVCVVPAKVLGYTATGFNWLLADTGSTTEWGGVFVRPNISAGSSDTALAIQWGMLDVHPGDVVRFVGYVDEFADHECLTTTQIVPVFSVPLQIGGNVPLPPPVHVRVSDFYEGPYPVGRIRCSTGEKYEGMCVRITNVTVAAYVNQTNCTFAFVDSEGNEMADYDASKWFTCRSWRDPNSTFSLPPLGTRIDSIDGFILSSSGPELARGYRIAPVYPRTEVGVRMLDQHPSSFALDQNYPNPFNPSTVIRFEVPGSGWASLKVYSILGLEAAALVEGWVTAGRHEVRFDASRLPSGVYFYRLRTAAGVLTRKLLVLR